MEFSHKWVNQVLQQRGLPSPGLERIKVCITEADEADKLRLYEVLRRLERGTESADDWGWLGSVLERAKSIPIDPPEPMPMAATRPADRVDTLIAAQPASTKKATYTEAKPLRPKHHIYGLKAALTVEMDELRTNGDGGVVLQTVILEAAAAVGHRSYDWGHKIAFQFMRRELPLLACALLGMLENPLELGNHGQDANKFVVIADQGEKLFVQVKQGARAIAVPVGPSDVHAWLELVMRALAANSPAMGEAIQLAALGRVAAMENKRVEKQTKWQRDVVP
ncbi:hypothetical protein [Polaromonas sp. JS666]|uniref:hypothetical protein n=1 Tax=Polaromonas sp. (strain JS666 / ATCC BAA-500) TaxID=296591 RepID=UPI0000D5B486|nr:hypothetical protein [Polaromonas sp. JS666]ABE46923.1 hypothetical protein Bpro_5051 [Polaromonas sp. JS666]